MIPETNRQTLHYNPTHTITNDDLPSLLVIHFDVNETLLVEDAAGGDSAEESLNKIIAKSAFCRIPEDQRTLPLREVKPTHWMDGTPMDGGDDDADNGDRDVIGWSNMYTKWNWPEYCCPYYKTSYKKNAKVFTEHPHGKMFVGVKDAIRKKLLIDEEYNYDNINNNDDDLGGGIDERISHDGIHHFLLPAFFECLYRLLKDDEVNQQKIRIVIRTFGSDLAAIADAINAFGEGKHPYFPNFRCSRLKLDRTLMYRGRWKKVKDSDRESISYQLTAWSDKDTDYDTSVDDLNGEVVAFGDENVLDIIEGRKRDSPCSDSIVCGIQDDYNFWHSHKYAPSAGKPVWIRSKNKDIQHIFFDDNIHNSAEDSIVSVRQEEKSSQVDDLDNDIDPRQTSSTINLRNTNFRSLSGSEIIGVQGRCLVRVPTVEPCLTQTWFLSQIFHCLNMVNK